MVESCSAGSCFRVSPFMNTIELPLCFARETWLERFSHTITPSTFIHLSFIDTVGFLFLSLHTDISMLGSSHIVLVGGLHRKPLCLCFIPYFSTYQGSFAIWFEYLRSWIIFYFDGSLIITNSSFAEVWSCLLTCSNPDMITICTLNLVLSMTNTKTFGLSSLCHQIHFSSFKATSILLSSSKIAIPVRSFEYYTSSCRIKSTGC